MSNASGSDDSKVTGPHQSIPAADERERFALEMFDILWERYRSRVSHVRSYEQVIAKAGATFVNDHIAYRTFACQQPLTGIASISRLFEAVGYRPAASYFFEDKHLNAIHFQHPNGQFPKIFVSELKTWELSPDSQSAICRTLSSHRASLSVETLRALAAIDADCGNRSELMQTVVEEFHQLPWDVPEKTDVEALSEESQYAAWVLVHGYNVNHFTSLVNSHGTESLGDIEKTVAALQRAGVPTKDAIEGEPGSKLRQSATGAAVIDVTVKDKGVETTMPWTYAYFELAERGDVTDPDTGRQVRFEGFLGPQATHLFEMTKVK